MMTYSERNKVLNGTMVAATPRARVISPLNVEQRARLYLLLTNPKQETMLQDQSKTGALNRTVWLH